MLLWRLSTRDYADMFDGGYGLRFDGRWNTIGHPVTYCATSPALCILEKLVHVEDPTLLPDLVMGTYEIADDAGVETIALGDLPPDWRRREGWTQGRGNAWHREGAAPLLRVPSAIVPLDRSPDLNVVINHRHAAAATIRRVAAIPFVLDPRLF